MLENSDQDFIICIKCITVTIDQWKSLEFMQAHNFVFMIYLVIKSEKSTIFFMHCNGYLLIIILYNISIDVTFTATELKLIFFII